jgi:uncharacterized protein YneF (UPF0154 family)
MMFGQDMGFATLILALCSIGVITGFFISTKRALKKFNRLDSNTQNKLLLLEYYMAAVRNLSEEDLTLFGKLPDEEIKYLNTIYDYEERIQAIRNLLLPNSP